MRVATEVRIFPLLNCHSEPSPSVAPLVMMLQDQGYGVEVREVPFALKPQGNAMLRIWARQCNV